MQGRFVADTPCLVEKQGISRFVSCFLSGGFDRILLKGGKMDQVKIGKFLKELRKQKGLTQEQIAEKFNVSNRTISRWENGNNMPDLDILIEISDYYEVDLREILNGERKSEDMDKEMKETVLQAVDYSNTEAERYNKRVRICNGIAMFFVLSYTVMKDTSLYDVPAVMIGLEIVQGLAIGMLFAGLLYSSRYGAKIRAFKHRLMKKQG